MAVVPFNVPRVVGSELEFIRDAISRSRLSGDGYYTRCCHVELEKMTGGNSALLTHSCTAALEMAAILANIQPGDEVILPSYTFVSTANSIVLRGGVPVFVDIRQDTLNIDPLLIQGAISVRTKAIFVVHYAGVPCDMDPILDIARRHKILVVEDAAQALGSTYKGRAAGALGDLAAFSFHETKNVISGEGGALIVNDPALVGRANIIREKGTNRKEFVERTVDKYTWVDIGSSYLPGELTAAYLYAQLLCTDKILQSRMATWNQYRLGLREFEGQGIKIPFIPDYAIHNAHMFYIVLPEAKLRSRFIAAMAADSIVTPFHYVPLHSSPAGLRYGRVGSEMKNTDDASAKLVRLPIYIDMGSELERVIDSVRRSLVDLL